MKCPHCGKAIDLSLDSDAFEAFWAIYPRKIAKGQARKAYKVAEAKIGKDILLESVKLFREQSKTKDKDFIPHASTWLTGERWTDEGVSPSVVISRDISSSGLAGGLAPPPAVHPSWPGETVVSLSAQIGAARFQAWLASSELFPSQVLGEPAIIKVRSTLSRDYITSKLAGALFRTIGPFEVVAH